MAKTPEEMAQSMIDNLPEKTGKDLKAWLAVVKKMKLDKHGAIVKALKADHGVTHGYANLIAHHALAAAAPAAGGDDDLVAAQYQGPKAELRPIYDAVVAAAAKLGKDVEVSPKKTYVSLRRSKQFAIVKASTKTRVDLGFNLKGVAAKGRLGKSKAFGEMCSHQVALGAKKDVDAEVKKWLKQAYEGA